MGEEYCVFLNPRLGRVLSYGANGNECVAYHSCRVRSGRVKGLRDPESIRCVACVKVPGEGVDYDPEKAVRCPDFRAGPIFMQLLEVVCALEEIGL